MYKVGVMMMGEPGSQSPKKVREVILEVEAKTKIADIFDYLIELDKIKNKNVSVAIEKDGQYINDSSTISQVLKYTRPVNGVIKLYLYLTRQAQTSLDKLVLKPSRHEVNNPQAYNKVVEQAAKNKQNAKKSQFEKNKNQDQVKSSGFCCC